MSGILNLLLAGAASVVKDAYFNLVTLLLNTTATNGAQNNTFLDSSTNNFSITRNGNTTQGTFTPFSQTGWGTYFTGSSTRLTYPGSSSTYVSGTGDFTIEMWINIDAASAGRSRVLIEGDVSNGIQMRLGPSNTNNINGLSVSRVFNADNEYCNYTFAFNTWYHVAVTRASAVYYFFVNGVQYTTQNAGQTGTYNFQVPTTVCIGDNLSYPNDEIYKGYISNIRVSNVGRYTSNFTPSTTPLTALSGTQFLSLQNNRWIDNSTNNSTISSNGTPSVQAFSPFAPTDAYSTSVVGGSGYVGGSSSYLTVTSQPLINVNDWTVEFWMYPISYVTGQGVFGCSNGGGPSPKISWQVNGSTIELIVYSGGFNTILNTPYPTINAWTYVSLSRSSSTGLAYLYYNGVLKTSASCPAATGVTGAFQLFTNGEGGTSGFYGYMSNARVSNTARYTGSNYSIPTSLNASDGSTRLLTNFTNAGIYDSAAKNDLETVGNAQVSTTAAKWDTTSMSFNGTSDYLKLPSAANLTLGTGDFTIECWVNPTNWNNANAAIVQANGASNGPQLSKYGGNNNLGFCNSGVGWIITDAALPTTSTWSHVAVTRSGTTFKIFINGTQSGSTVTSSANLSGALATIGANNNTEFYAGYIDDLRVTKGYARYTANFTPPAAAFPIQ